METVCRLAGFAPLPFAVLTSEKAQAPSFFLSDFISAIFLGLSCQHAPENLIELAFVSFHENAFYRLKTKSAASEATLFAACG